MAMTYTEDDAFDRLRLVTEAIIAVRDMDFCFQYARKVMCSGSR